MNLQKDMLKNALEAKSKQLSEHKELSEVEK